MEVSRALSRVTTALRSEGAVTKLIDGVDGYRYVPISLAAHKNVRAWSVIYLVFQSTRQHAHPRELRMHHSHRSALEREREREETKTLGGR